MSEWYYSSAAYALFALSTCQVNVDESLLFHRTLAFFALMILSFVHLMHGLTNRGVSTWAFAFAYLLHFATYGIFFFRGCVVWNAMWRTQIARFAMCWFFLDAMIFCNKIARWLQKIVATEGRVDFSWMLLSFVTTLQDDSKDSSTQGAGWFLGCYYLL